MTAGRDENIRKAEEYIRKCFEKYDFLQYFYDYLVTNAGRTHSIQTYKKYITYVKSMLDMVGKNDVAELTMDDVNHFIAMKTKKANGDATTGDYQVVIYSAISQFCNFLFKTGRTKINLMGDSHCPRSTPEHLLKKTRVYLTIDEIQECYHNVELSKSKMKVRDKLLLGLFLDTGIRITALSEISIEDIDFKEWRIWITEKENNPTDCFFSNKVLELLNEWIPYREKLIMEYESKLKEKSDKIQRNYNRTNALFISTRCKRMSIREIQYTIKKYASINDKHITPHKLRHTFATQMSQKEHLSPKEICDLMNNNNAAMVQRIYIGEDENIRKENSMKSAGFSVF